MLNSLETFSRNLEFVRLSLYSFLKDFFSRYLTNLNSYKWDKVFKSGPGKICGRQPLKNLKGYKFFKGCLPQILLGPLLNTWTHALTRSISSFRDSTGIYKSNRANKLSIFCCSCRRRNVVLIFVTNRST